MTISYEDESPTTHPRIPLVEIAYVLTLAPEKTPKLPEGEIPHNLPAPPPLSYESPHFRTTTSAPTFPAVSTKQSAQLGLIDNWFSYHGPKGDQLARYQLIRDAGKALATTIVMNTPISKEQQMALDKIREAVMIANAAIACNE